MSKVLLILLVLLFGQAQCNFGIDVSQLFSVENYTCCKNNGITFGIPRGYCSFGGMDQHAVQSLTNMRQAGLRTDTYMFPCRGKNATAQVNEMISNIPSNLYDRIWIDIETNPSPGCSWNDHDADSNCEFTLELIKAIRAKGRSVGVYASKYMWGTIFKSYTACPQASVEVPLWYPHYDDNPSFADYAEFGGWKTPTIKQYHNTMTLCGVSMDRNYMP
jgi:GH25 family lysozyme M1 (1,4-beta-N-acetylmuramidase)